jgi:hypothetical protein
LETVKARLREPKRWEAFWANKAEGKRTTDVASDLKMTRAATSVAVGDVERMLRKEMENRLNRLLAATGAGGPSEELARYSGRTLEQLRGEGVRLMETLRVELDRLLAGLTEVATEGKSASATARELKMPIGDFGQAADGFGQCVEEEVTALESKEPMFDPEAEPRSQG